MKRATIILILFNILIGLNAQVLFDKAFDGGYDDSDEAMAVKQTSDGGFVMAGAVWTSDDNWYDMTIMKIDANGEKEWVKTYNKGSMSLDIAYSIDLCSDGGYILAGGTDGASNENQVWIIRLDASGDSLWSKFYGGDNQDYAHGIQTTSDGGFIIAAETNSYGAGLGDGYAIKLDADGNEEWSKTYGGVNPDIFYDVKQTTDGGYVFAGAADGYMDAYIVRTNSNGDTLWTKKLGGPVTEEAYSIDLTSDGGYIFTGKTMSFGAGNYDYWLVKLDADGNEEWSKTFGGELKDKGFGVCQLDDGGYMVTGMTESFTNGEEDEDLYVVRTDANGDEIWAKNFGGEMNDGGNKCLQAADGTLVSCGYHYTSGMQFDFYLVKMNMDGLVLTEVNISNNHNVTISPNPIVDESVLRFSNSDNASFEMQLLDISGKEVMTIRNITSDEVTIRKGNLPRGIYMLQLRSSSKIYKEKVFIH